MSAGSSPQNHPTPGPELSGAPSVVLFDLDGTLTASGPGILASVRYALTELGQPVPPPAALDSFIGPPLLDSFREVCGMDVARAQGAIAAYRLWLDDVEYTHRLCRRAPGIHVTTSLAIHHTAAAAYPAAKYFTCDLSRTLGLWRH